MSVNGQLDPYMEGEAIAREVREAVADQLHDLVVERNGLGSLDEIARRVRLVAEAHRRVQEARGRQRQADEHGLPKAKHAADEQEARGMLRASLLSLGEECGSVVVGLDVEPRVRS